MTVESAVLAGLGEVRSWQEDFYRDLHQHPELSHQEHRTAGKVADQTIRSLFHFLQDRDEDRTRLLRRSNAAIEQERNRIARDLHDLVIQRLFATGLTIQSLAAGAPSEQDAGRLSAAVGDIDETIRQIRTSIFQLRGSLVPNSGGVRARILEIAEDLKNMLGFDPVLHFDGPVDSTVPDNVISELLAVARESLTNVARHADASNVTVTVTAGADLTLEVVDNGVGLGESTRRSGLANMKLRAERLHGAMSVTDATQPESDTGRRGTKLQWKVPLP